MGFVKVLLAKAAKASEVNKAPVGPLIGNESVVSFESRVIPCSMPRRCKVSFGKFVRSEGVSRARHFLFDGRVEI